MKLIFGLCLFVAIAYATTADLDKEWAEYKKTFGKSYPDSIEDARRKEIFRHNFDMIEENNRKYEAGEVTWKMGINDFADMTYEEIKQRFPNGVVY